jgi:DNA ligase-1
MQTFIRLYSELDSTTGTNAKELALRRYFSQTCAHDAAWAVYFLAGGTPKRLVKTTVLKTLPGLVRDIPDWLFAECYETVGDLAETIALLLPVTVHVSAAPLGVWIEQYLLPLRTVPVDQQADYLLPLLAQLDTTGKMICLKLITGSFRVGVSRLTVIKALAAFAGIDAKLIAQRLVGLIGINRFPTADDFTRLIQPENNELALDTQGLPYPFFLAHPLNLNNGRPPENLGNPVLWFAEWKWDGIRVQLVKRQGKLWIWSRGEELITERFPEIADMASTLLPDGTVLDGELVIWRDGKPQPFAQLQKRIGRLKVSPKLLQEAPAGLIVYDLLEWQGQDRRSETLSERRALLEHCFSELTVDRFQLSPLVDFQDWHTLATRRAESRSRNVEGLMLKEKSSRYGTGRTKDVGIWWKWKIDPFTIDAVLINAQRGHGRRASLYTDYTFAVWDGSDPLVERNLLPFAKAYSGLTDTELREADLLIRKTMIERFGPVCTVEPTQVFEIGFEGIAPSNRHKSGISVRFPRILRWRRDKPIQEANTLEDLRKLLE